MVHPLPPPPLLLYVGCLSGWVFECLVGVCWVAVVRQGSLYWTYLWRHEGASFSREKQRRRDATKGRETDLHIDFPNASTLFAFYEFSASATKM